MENRTLYDMSEIDVYIKYFKYLDEFGKLKIKKEDKNNLFNYYNEYLINYGDRILFRELMLIISSYEENYYDKFNEIVRIQYLNEFLRLNYKKLHEVYNILEIKPIDRIIECQNTFNDSNIDCYYESLRLNECNNVNNRITILNKISEMFNILNYLNKINLIEEETFNKIYNHYDKIMASYEYIVGRDQIIRIVDDFGNSMNRIYYNKKKTKKF